MKILFVCLGNICRSPTAQGVLEKIIADRKVEDIVVDSAGTANYHLGSAPDPRSIKYGNQRGYDLSSLRARQVSRQDFYEFNYILAMDNSNFQYLKTQQPADSVARVQLATSFAEDVSLEEVPDPYYGSEKEFNLVLDLSESIAHGILNQLT